MRPFSSFPPFIVYPSHKIHSHQSVSNTHTHPNILYGWKWWINKQNDRNQFTRYVLWKKKQFEISSYDYLSINMRECGKNIVIPLDHLFVAWHFVSKQFHGKLEHPTNTFLFTNLFNALQSNKIWINFETSTTLRLE